MISCFNLDDDKITALAVERSDNDRAKDRDERPGQCPLGFSRSSTCSGDPLSRQHHRHRRVEGSGRSYRRTAHHRLCAAAGDGDRLDIHRRRCRAHSDRRLRHGGGRSSRSARSGVAGLGPSDVCRIRRDLGHHPHSDANSASAAGARIRQRRRDPGKLSAARSALGDLGNDRHRHSFG